MLQFGQESSFKLTDRKLGKKTVSVQGLLHFLMCFCITFALTSFPLIFETQDLHFLSLSSGDANASATLPHS